MSLNLVPQPENCPAAALPRTVPVIGVRTAGLVAALPSLPERLAWARENGFEGVEIAATGRPRDLYAPSVSREERARLRGEVAGFAAVAVQAPHQETYDVSLVSPSASIRRASVTEIWSCLRFAEALGGGTVVVRTGNAPAGVDADRQQAFVAECLTTLDRMAGDHNARIAVALADYFGPAGGGEVRDGRLDLLLRHLALPHTGIALDATSFADAPATNVSALARRAGAKLAHVRAGDPAPELADALRTIGYTGLLGLIAEPDAPFPMRSLSEAKLAWEGLLARAAV